MLRKCKIQVENFGAIESAPGPLFLELLDARQIDLHNDCGGHLKCGKCRIVFIGDAPEPLAGDRRHLSEAEIHDGTRLACIHQLRRDCVIRVPEPVQAELDDDL